MVPFRAAVLVSTYRTYPYIQGSHVLWGFFFFFCRLTPKFNQSISISSTSTHQENTNDKERSKYPSDFFFVFFAPEQLKGRQSFILLLLAFGTQTCLSYLLNYSKSI